MPLRRRWRRGPLIAGTDRGGELPPDEDLEGDGTIEAEAEGGLFEAEAEGRSRDPRR